MFPLKLSLLFFLLGLCQPNLSGCRKSERNAEPASEYAETQRPEPLVLDAAALESIAQFARASQAATSSAVPGILKGPCLGVYLATRAEGRRLAETWGYGATAGDALHDALSGLPSRANADTLEVFIAMDELALDAKTQGKRIRSNVHRGVFGLQIGSGAKREMHSPTYAVASNRKNGRLIELYTQKHSLSKEALDKLFYAFLSGPQLLIPLDKNEPALLMERGNRYVDLAEVTQPAVTSFAIEMGEWMWNNLHSDGRMTYLYYPSQGQEATGRDNLIRQFMASIALVRSASASKKPELAARAARNIDYNLDTYFSQEGELGLVTLRGKVKLGALALAALAIVEHPERERWTKQEAALRASVQHLWRPDGSFRSFLRPEGRNDNQNFYPGEALLLWTTLYTENHDPKLLAQIMKSFAYYRDWHLDASVQGRRNPAFIPWHTQAYAMLWNETREPELAAFIFEMNDWLLDVQEWDKVLYPDTRGRFYDQARPFGPPHASATGVYLEGLIDAYALARTLDDTVRAQRYQKAIRRGLRSSMQLQFSDDIDMFYVYDKERVRGGLRTTVYDNQIRCDNVQHTLMAAMKILGSDVLEDPLPLRD